MRKATSARRTNPPITPPTIAPVGADEDEVEDVPVDELAEAEATEEEYPLEICAVLGIDVDAAAAALV